MALFEVVVLQENTYDQDNIPYNNTLVATFFEASASFVSVGARRIDGVGDNAHSATDTVDSVSTSVLVAPKK